MEKRPELQVLAALCLTPMRPEAIEATRSLIVDNFDWLWVLDRARRWDVATVVMTNLANVPGEKIPASILETVSEERVASRAEIVGKILRVSNVVGKFSDAAIDAIVLKGPATGVSAYGDASLRNFADLDLFIRRNDVAKARDLVVSLGFKPRYKPASESDLISGGHALEFKRSTLKVELHTQLLSRYLRVPFDEAEIWETSRIVSCANRDIRVLAPYVEFVFLAAHGAKHEWTVFRWVCDLANLTARLTADDTTQVIELSARLHCRKLVSLALRLVRETFTARIPADLENLMRAYKTRSMADKVLATVGAGGEVVLPRQSLPGRIHPAIPALLFWCGSRERWRDSLLSASDLILRRRLNPA
jgi:hypothetical protein